MLYRVSRILLSVALMALAGVGMLWLIGRAQNAPIEEEPTKGGSEFALFTRQTYSTKDRPKFLLSYRNIDRLDFRVYRIDKPVEFFSRLRDLHQFGEREEQMLAHKITPLERFSTWKFKTLQSIRNFVRVQVSLKARVEVHKKLYKDENQALRRAPLNHADFEAIPLLNSYGLVESWREPLRKVAQSDYSSIPLATQQPGLYLVEAAYDQLHAYTLVFVTDLAVVTKTWDDQIVAYTVDRTTGAPVPGATVEFLYEKVGADENQPQPARHRHRANNNGDQKPPLNRVSSGRATTDKDGAWQAGMPKDSNGSPLLLASHEKDFLVVDLGQGYGYRGEYEGDEGANESNRVYIYTDRPVYRPSHTVNYKAILRRGTDRGYSLPSPGSAQVTVSDPKRKTVHQATLAISKNGTIAGSFDLDEAASLGSYSISVTAGELSSTFYFSVEEYKKPEYKVSVTFKEKRVLSGTPVTATISAKYYFGAPVKNATVKYQVYREVYYPPWQREEDKDEIGDLAPEGEEKGSEGYSYGNNLVTEGEGDLDKDGQFTVTFQTTLPKQDNNEPYYTRGRDFNYRVEATVTDAARRDITESGSILATNGNFTLTVSTDQYLYKPSEQVKLTIRAADYDGHPVSTPVKVQLVRFEYQRIENEGDPKHSHTVWVPKPVIETNTKTGADGTAQVSIAASVVGHMEIIATAQEGDRTISSPYEYVWVSGDEADSYFDYYGSDSYDIKLIPDKKSYKPGEHARVLVTLGDANSHLIVGLEGRKLVKSWLVEAHGKSAVIDVPINRTTVPEGVPNIYLTVAYVRNGKMHTGTRSLNVPPIEKLLDVKILPDRPEYKPRETATYTIITRNSSGAPVPAEVSLGVVDEAIYAIQGESAENIKSAFYKRISNSVQTSYAADYEFSGYSSKEALDLASRDRIGRRAPFADMKPEAKVQVRKNFKDTAFWAPSVMTDANGQAQVKVELPDNLTTWRATVRAVTTKTEVGSAVERIIARKNLLVRLATPRFFTEDDEVTVSAIVHNYLKSTQQVRVSLETRGVQIASGPPLMTVSIEAGGEWRVDWRVKATNPGDAVLTAKAVTDQESDGMELTLPVHPHGILIGHGESVALTEPDAQATLKTTFGPDASPESRKIRVDLSSSIAGTAFGALDYLTSYPYGCVEQTMSGFLPDVIVTRALRDLGGAATVSGNELALMTNRGLRRLYDYQHADGGWGWWKTDDTDPYMTAHVVAGFAEAARAGYKIDDGILSKGRNWIRNELDRDRSWREPIGLDDRVYLLYALVTSGKEDAGRVESLAGSVDKLEPLSKAWLALSLDAVGDRARAVEIAKKLESSASGNNVESYWPSKRRPMLDYEEDASLEATAMTVRALARLIPQSPVLPRAATWLVNHRTNGYYWMSTKHTAFAINALIDYARATGELQANYDWEVSINGKPYSSGHVTAADARSGKSVVVNLKPEEILNGTNEVRVTKRGVGTLWAAIYSVYFTREADIKASGSDAISVGREYFRLTLGTDTNGQAILTPSKFDGKAKSGDLILVRLTLDGKAARYLMLEDPFPAGTEPFTNDKELPGTLPYIDWANWGWAEKEFHDDRAAFFITHFDRKTVWQYVLRVQIPGDFRVAPARAERMYQPDVRANSASARIQISDK